jgi:hypothetical protein
MLAAIEELQDLAITTNGFLLERDAAALLAACGSAARPQYSLQRLGRLAAARPLSCTR